YLDRPILSKPEEQRLGRQVRLALKIKQKVEQLLEEKELLRLEILEQQQQQQQEATVVQEEEEDDFTMEEELEDFLMRTVLPSGGDGLPSGHYIRDYYHDENDSSNNGNNDDEDEDLLGLSVYDSVEDASTNTAATTNQKLLQEFDSRSVVTKGADSLDITDITLSDQEIKEHLDISGGRKELYQILVDGALAKEQMIKSNVRLVMSIAQKWMNRSQNAADGVGQTPTNLKRSGSWTKPSLDEVVQEGILGLAKAAERFEPERNLKFSTYATYYITNETGKGLDISVAARQLDVKLNRLEFILQMTQPLLQLDGPIKIGMGFANGAGKAGSFGSYAALPSFAEALEW
ncbi:MAG: hypothetical protein SGILL_005351, partial [Bacillariaceae sp.]